VAAPIRAKLTTYMQLPTHDDVAVQGALEGCPVLGLGPVDLAEVVHLLQEDEEQGHEYEEDCQAAEVGHGGDVPVPAQTNHGGVVSLIGLQGVVCLLGSSTRVFGCGYVAAHFQEVMCA